METTSSIASELWDIFGQYSVDVRIKVLGSEYHYSHYYSALDSIQDMDRALYEFSLLKRKSSLLECLGFLQCLIIQHDAVLLLSKIFNLDWHYESEVDLQNIRNIRNRVIGHPNEAKKQKPRSTSFLPTENITKDAFEAVIQFDGNWVTEVINFEEYISKNNLALTRQLLQILESAKKFEKKMFKQQPYETWVGGVKQAV